MRIDLDHEVTLELTDQKHAPGLFAAVDANRCHLSEFLPWVGNMRSVDDFANYIYNCERLYKDGNEVSFVIIKNGDVIGRIGLHHMNMQNKYAEIGYWLIKDAEGNGIITEAAKAVINYGFNTVALQRIAIKAATENKKSQAIPKRLNFKQEGVLRQAEYVNGKFFDLVLFSILKDDWLKS